VEIFVPLRPEGRLLIGPLGADYPEVTVNYPLAWGRSPQFGEISPRPRTKLDPQNDSEQMFYSGKRPQIRQRNQGNAVPFVLVRVVCEVSD
jgi:hypothetical protein